LLWKTVWDSTNDAQEFFDAYATMQMKRIALQSSAAAAVAEETPTTRYWSRAAGQTFLERRDTTVIFMDGVPQELLPELQHLPIW
jgi:hypothetical protein